MIFILIVYRDIGSGYPLFALISCNMGKLTLWIPTRSDTNRAVQPLEMARGLKFWIKEVEVLYCWNSEPQM